MTKFLNFKTLVFSLALFVGIFCLADISLAQGTSHSVSEVLVVINDNSADSIEVGNYYKAARSIPDDNICHIQTATTDSITNANYGSQIKTPVLDCIQNKSLNINFIVLTRGVPLLISDWAHRNVDCLLVIANPSISYYATSLQYLSNPYYYQSSVAFNRANNAGMYLVTRLDGYTLADAKALVDRSVQATAQNGVFLFDLTPSREDYLRTDQMRYADDYLKSKGFTTYRDETSTFIGNQSNVMGYVSWGSNDPGYTKALYQSNTFLPGSIGETFVSSGARTLHDPNASGQSLIADLIKQGITGISGYIQEPGISHTCDSQTQFRLYTSGYNLAESFFGSQEYIAYETVIIGDPLCAPYSSSLPPNNAPVLAAIGAKPAKVGEELSFSVSATDVDSDPLTYSATPLPQGATFSNQTFRWTPSGIQVGVAQVNFSVSDGKATDSENVSITVTDAAAPTVPANLITTVISSTQINLSWSASTDNVGVTSYKIYRNGTFITNAVSASYSNTNLSPATTYTYKVSSYDLAGNESAQSTEAQATTQVAAPQADTTPPVAPTGVSVS